MNTIFVNGQMQSTVSALDRGLLYGDSLFETIAVDNQTPLMLDAHLQRLRTGANILNFDIQQSQVEEQIYAALNHCEPDQKAVLRVTITRGEQSRGYQPIKGLPVNSILSIHKWPEHPKHIHTNGMKLGLSSIRYAQQPQLAGIKHGNRLEQVLAAQSITSDLDDMVLLDTQDNVISTSKGNLFIQFGKDWFTPDLTQCGINGVVRASLIEHFADTHIHCEIGSIKYTDLQSRMHEITAVFCCNSIMGIVPVCTLFSHEIDSIPSCQPLHETLTQAQVIAS